MNVTKRLTPNIEAAIRDALQNGQGLACPTGWLLIWEIEALRKACQLALDWEEGRDCGPCTTTDVVARLREALSSKPAE